jgi:hypothetical protein
VIGVEERDEHVHVEQRYARHRFTRRLSTH